MSQKIHDLVKKGADVNAKYMKPSFGKRTPIFYAAMNGHVGAIKALVKHGADINGGGTREFAPLHTAAHGGHVDAVNTLIGHGSNVNAQDHMGNTPLHVAVKAGHVNVVETLVGHG